MRLVSELFRHLLPGVIRPLHVLWNEVIGFIFIVLAVLVSASIWRKAGDLSADGGGILFLAISILFALMLAWFGISSFWKARKISRSAPIPPAAAHRRR